MTLAEINRMIRAAIRAARKEGATVVEVKIGDATVRIPLAPDKPGDDNHASDLGRELSAEDELTRWRGRRHAHQS
jgi:hypothetical protein